MDYKTLILQKEGPIAILTLNRPKTGNSLLLSSLPLVLYCVS